MWLTIRCVLISGALLFLWNDSSGELFTCARKDACNQNSEEDSVVEEEDSVKDSTQDSLVDSEEDDDDDE